MLGSVLPRLVESGRAGLIVLASAVLAFAGAGPVAAQETVVYQTRPGDTLISLASRYFIDARQYRQVQTINGVADPRRLAIGKVLRIPKDLLRSKPAQLSVAGFSGPVEIAVGAARLTPSKGLTVPEGAVIRTGANGFIALGGDRGSQVSLPSRSNARIRRARQYLLNNALDVEFELLTGRGEFQPPKLNANESYTVRTPRGVAAVRGTVFRRSILESGDAEGTEVLEGDVAMESAGASRAVPAGFGLLTTPAGLGTIEQLLPAPKLENPARVQTDEALSFAIVPADRAVGYRVQIARDAGFVETINERVDNQPRIELESVANGNYFVRIAAIAASGLEGETETYSFRRQRLGVSAGAEPSPLGNGYAFRWSAIGAEDARFDFRLWRADAEANPLVHELAIDRPGLILTDLPAGVYVWQVAAVTMGPDGLLRVWGSPQRLTVAK